MGRKLLSRSNEFLGVDQKVWINLETAGFGEEVSGNTIPQAPGAIDFTTTNVTFDIPRDDSPSRSGRSVIARLSGKKNVETNVESHIIPGDPDALGNPTLPPMHPFMLTAFGEVDTSDPTKIVYNLSRFNGNSARILEEATHYSRVTVGCIMDGLTFNLPGDDKATMSMEGFAQDSFIAGESKLAQALTGSEQLAALILQDLTYTAKAGTGSQGNLISVEYTTGATAGSEAVTVIGNAITVQIEDGVSTADQIKTAVDADVDASALVDLTVSGTGTNAQSVAVAANLSGGLAEDEFKVEAGQGIRFEFGAWVDIIDGNDGDTNIVSARRVVAINNISVPKPEKGGVNADIIRVEGGALPVAAVGDFALGHAPEDYDPLTSEKALLGLKGSLSVDGVAVGDGGDGCDMISAEISLTNNFTQKDFLYGTSRICGFIPDTRREVSVNLEILLNKDNFDFYMRNKCFVAEDITITLEPQDICGPAFANSTGRTFEFKFPKVEFNIPPIENPSDSYVTLSLEGKALAPSNNQRDEEFTLTIR